MTIEIKERYLANMGMSGWDFYINSRWIEFLPYEVGFYHNGKNVVIEDTTTALVIFSEKLQMNETTKPLTNDIEDIITEVKTYIKS